MDFAAVAGVNYFLKRRRRHRRLLLVSLSASVAARAYPDGEKLSGIPADFPFSAEHGNDFPVLRVARKKAVSGGLGGILSAGRRDGGNA